MKRILVALIALALTAIPASAVAQDNAAVDEYTESVPGGGGDTPSNRDPQGGGSPLPPSVVESLEQAGPDGAAAATLAQSSGGPGQSDDQAGSLASSSSHGDRSGSSEGGFGSAVTELLDPGSDSGLGVWLPIILGVAFLAAIAFTVIRRRGSGPDTPASA